MNCKVFRVAISSSELDAATLEHFRHCSSCLEYAAGLDPQNLYRSLGGVDLVPPDGLESFVGDVMHEVHLRQTEGHVEAPGRIVASYRWGVAAALLVGIFASTVRHEPPASSSSPVQIAAANLAAASTRPVVESYEAKDATIVEVPAAAGAGDVKVVMVFDNTLPADL